MDEQSKDETVVDSDIELTPQEKVMRTIFGREWRDHIMSQDKKLCMEQGRNLRLDTHKLVVDGLQAESGEE